jgi:sugar lactone lactonase YvrE
VVADGRGNVYVNGAGFNPMAGEAFMPGCVVLAAADGSVRRVAEDIAFPNGMAVTPDNSTLIVELDRGGFACTLGGPDGRTLFITAAEWRGMTESEMVTPGSGQVLCTRVDVPGAGWP